MLSRHDTLWGIGAVWGRYFAVYRKNIKYAIITTFSEPLLYILSFGYGLGGLIEKVSLGPVTLSYRQFIFAGIVAQSVLFQAYFDGAYGGFIRMYYQKIFKAIASTPITMSEVLWGELLWNSAKATFSASIVLLIGTLTGDFSGWGALGCVPLCFIGAFLFTAMGMLTAALSQTIEQISYPQYLFVFPMFLFCGTYFPMEQLPYFLQLLGWILPLTSLLSLVRWLALGTPFVVWAIPILAVWTGVFVLLARHRMIRRLIK